MPGASCDIETRLNVQWNTASLTLAGQGERRGPRSLNCKQSAERFTGALLATDRSVVGIPPTTELQSVSIAKKNRASERARGRHRPISRESLRSRACMDT